MTWDYLQDKYISQKKKDCEIDWFSSLMIVLYDTMQKSAILITKSSEFAGFIKVNIKIYEILIIIPALE